MLDLDVKILQKEDNSENEIIQLTELINLVYETSEKEFWPTDGTYARTNVDEITEFISKGEMMVVKHNDQIVGCVHIYPINKETLGFGMLTCSLNFRKLGIGNLLLSSIERYAKENNYVKIQLELLKPETFNHPEKDFLEKWYGKWGYLLIESVPYKKLYFKQAPMLKFPCKFDIFQKQL